MHSTAAEDSMLTFLLSLRHYVEYQTKKNTLSNFGITIPGYII